MSLPQRSSGWHRRWTIAAQQRPVWRWRSFGRSRAGLGKEQPDVSAFGPLAAHGKALVVHARTTQNDPRPGDLAVLGLPFEDTSAPFAGQSLAPRALRETSVYFGWHANPQLSHPVDVDARQDISTDGLHAKLGDLGDLAPGSEDRIHPALEEATRQIFRAGACVVLLGGSDQLSWTVQKALPDCQVVQLG